LKEEHKFEFVFDKSKLRTSISTISNNSWVKGKKKLTVAGDYDLILAVKSIFHSLRILDFGIQICNSGRVENYGSMNYILDDLKKLSQQHQREELWLKIEDKYKKFFNAKASQFKELAPKDLTEIDKKSKLRLLFKKYNLDNNDLFEEILNIV
jgi:hypothetical protein